MTALLLVTGSAPAAPLPLNHRQLPPVVMVNTSGCGFGRANDGTAVPVGGDLAVTAAHVVLEADQVWASWGLGAHRVAQVIAVDTRSDLALLRVAGLDQPPVRRAQVDAGESLTLATAVSGPLPATVRRRVRIRMERLREKARDTRMGYELTATVATGDSGAGGFTADGRLAGIVFAAGEDDRAWLTSSQEVAALLSAADPDAVLWGCQAERSRLLPSPS
ncbi:MAG: S1 family peptidase [Euzebya sp.]